MTAVEAFLQRAVDLLVSQRQQWGGWFQRAGYLNLVTIIPRALMGSESIAHETELKAEWAIDSGAMRERGIIVLVKSN